MKQTANNQYMHLSNVEMKNVKRMVQQGGTAKKSILSRKLLFFITAKIINKNYVIEIWGLQPDGLLT